MSRTRYSPDWKQIATAVKNSSDWRCSRCERPCLRPGFHSWILDLSGIQAQGEIKAV